MAFSMAMGWNEGEEAMHRLLNVPEQDNPTSTGLAPGAVFMLQRAPLLAIGTLDSENRPWTTIWGGDPGFSQPLGSSIIGTKTLVDRKYDPVVQALFGGRADGEVVKEEGKGRMIGGLTIDLMTRRRVKLYGRMVAGAVDHLKQGQETNLDVSGVGQIQLVTKIEQSLGNCPKYLNKKEIHSASPVPILTSGSPQLSEAALNLLAKADLFFITSSNNQEDMDTNHRGGPAGFIRVLSNDTLGAELVWPEYSGNRLYQTLGNLYGTPLAGLVFPDFSTGNVLYLTGRTTILTGQDSENVMPHTNLAVKVTVTAARFVERGLPFRGIEREKSPYNPPLRLLSIEGSRMSSLSAPSIQLPTATLIKKTLLTPSIACFRFRTAKPVSYTGGQWAVFDFKKELDLGYSHMRDSDPRSLNDDFVRTFTVSSPPAMLADNEFEITIRNVGPVTGYLFRQKGESELKVPLKGFGGDFKLKEGTGESKTAFVAGGVGITPFLACLDKAAPVVFWSLRVADLPFVEEVLRQAERHGQNGFKDSMRVFVTSRDGGLEGDTRNLIERIREKGLQIKTRRLVKEDLVDQGCIDDWYVCAGEHFQKNVLEWLEGRRVIVESFNY
ncbi:oxidoreductase-like protein [Patellaria atrata CBS 101060]|uniref:Oxidoreductase-like protein n=1 Tax=Patellaria atrata CBS 101060 TaxID=1346257 RepID=A0A9P4VLJ8_9PEZI|nr:oxidoreductase-like protein [Patellaria atrata CBS 101060]